MSAHPFGRPVPVLANALQEDRTTVVILRGDMGWSPARAALEAFLAQRAMNANAADQAERLHQAVLCGAVASGDAMRAIIAEATILGEPCAVRSDCGDPLAVVIGPVRLEECPQLLEAVRHAPSAWAAQ